MIAEVRRRFRLLSPAERARWGLLVCLAVVTATLEAVSGAVVYALVAALIGSSGPAGRDAIVQAVTSSVRSLGLAADMVSLATALAVVQVTKTLLRVLAAYCRGWVQATGSRSLVTRVFRAYLAAPYPFHLRRGATELVQNVLGSAGSLFAIFDDLLTLAMEGLVVASLLLIMGWVTPGETLALAVLVGSVLAVFVRVTRRAYRRWGVERWRLDTAMLRNLHQSLAGIKEVKVLGREGHFADAFHRDLAAAGRLQLVQIVVGGIPRVLSETSFLCGAAALLLLGRLRGAGGADLLPLLGLYAYTGFRALPAAQRVAQQITSIRMHLGRTDSLSQDLTTLLEMTAAPAVARNGPAPRAPTRLPFRERIAVENVSFAYEGTRAPVLAEVSLTIRRGESVGFVGATGAGKTTLADLILGLLTPTAGRITVDGEPIEGDLRGWQDRIGYVPQSPFLIDDTLRRNIAFGVAEADVDEDRVASALQIAQLHSLAASLPKGLHTSVGERGVRLSGGERQRVAIARALYHDPELLVFDEATSSLDPATERELTLALERLRGRKTILVIAHRLSTVRRCDRLVMLRAGRIEAVGPYDELVARSAAFRTLSALPEPAGPESVATESVATESVTLGRPALR